MDTSSLLGSRLLYITRRSGGVPGTGAVGGTGGTKTARGVGGVAGAGAEAVGALVLGSLGGARGAGAAGGAYSAYRRATIPISFFQVPDSEISCRKFRRPALSANIVLYRCRSKKNKPTILT